MSDDEPRRPVYIQRRRVGVIRFYDRDRRYGFIEAEDFRDDVFFLLGTFEASENEAKPYVGMVVEYEIDEEHRRETDRLRASVCRPTSRPVGRRLVSRDAPSLNAQHHPRARRRKPAWRKKP